VYDLEKTLVRESSISLNDETGKQPDWIDIRNKLKNNEAAIEIIRFRDYQFDLHDTFTDSILYAALIVTSETRNNPELVLLADGNSLEKRYIHFYRNAIQYKIDDSLSYKYFWEPISDKLRKRINKIYFSPDGIYNQINLNTLKNPGTGTFLLDDIKIIQVTNTKDLLMARDYGNVPSGNRKAKAVLFGNPAFGKVGSSKPATEARVRGVNLIPLPGTALEIQRIAGYLSDSGWESVSYSGPEANESMIKRINNPTVLHVATHGFFEEGYSERLSGDPLLQSGLLLADVENDTTFYAVLKNDFTMEDGILTSYEASNLDIEDTRLVVLSACETGLGEIKNGEGVYGLQRALLVAGADTIIMSYWKVDDTATQELMANFYRIWLQHGNLHESFRSAQQSLKKSHPSPYYWGAFVMIGE
jgi:CHAT domain-containing protein